MDIEARFNSLLFDNPYDLLSDIPNHSINLAIIRDSGIEINHRDSVLIKLFNRMRVDGQILILSHLPAHERGTQNIYDITQTIHVRRQTSVHHERSYSDCIDYIFWILLGSTHTFNNLEAQSYTNLIEGTQDRLDDFALMRSLIRTHSNPNDIVFDPFAGRGSVYIAGLSANRRMISCQPNGDLYEAIKNRMNKGMGNGQLDMFRQDGNMGG